MKKKKILIASATVGVMLIAAFVISSIRLYLIEKKMPPMQDVYFTAYETSKGDTVLYKYDVQKGKTEVAARIEGYFRNCEIDSKKEYIIGVLEASIAPSKNEGYKVVRYCIADGKWEVCVSTEEILSLDKGKFLCSATRFQDDGKSVVLQYSGEFKKRYILYDIETKKYQDANVEAEEVIEIEGVSNAHVFPSNNKKSVHTSHRVTMIIIKSYTYMMLRVGQAVVCFEEE